MPTPQDGLIILASLAGTYLLLLLISPKYRADTAMMFRLEKSSPLVAIDNPVATLAHLLSLVLPLYFLG